MKRSLLVTALIILPFLGEAQTTVTTDATGNLNVTKMVAQASGGQIFFTGRQLGTTYSYGAGIFRAATDNSNGAANFFFDGIAGSNRNFFVRADGFGYFATTVGIGTTTPSANLSVSHSGGNNQVGLASAVDVYSSVNDRSRISIGNTSNFSTSSALLFYGKNAANSALETKWEIGTDLNQNHGRDMYFYNDNISDVQLMLHGNGNVGIGTRDPGAWKLAVNGNIRAKEIKVETSWSDYVFYKNYRLRPLNEVERYIKLNQHLPEVPSAAEVEKDGVSLGQTSSMLLKKIEELTLYLIEQNKRIEQLELQVKKQR